MSLFLDTSCSKRVTVIIQFYQRILKYLIGYGGILVNMHVIVVSVVLSSVGDVYDVDDACGSCSVVTAAPVSTVWLLLMSLSSPLSFSSSSALSLYLA
jgi:hypothetical protein